MSPFMQLVLFTAEAIIVILIIFIILIGVVAILTKGKEKSKAKLKIKNLNTKYADVKDHLMHETLNKKQFKAYLKERKAEEKALEKSEDHPSKVFVLTFHGDIKASAVASLSEEITAILNVATPNDEVVLRLESGGGVVHGYGLAAAQLMRLKEKHIPLTVAIDKIAASGGYMMACVANKIIAAPFAIIGSIGVIVQLPNFNRLLKDKNIDFEQLTAGEYKRTITLFGENTDEGREKLRHEIEDVHQLFKSLITQHRQQIDINKVATGEHWLGQQALALDLVDEIKTSDDYILEKCHHAKVFEICYEVKKPLLSRLTSSSNTSENILQQLMIR